MSTHRSTDLGAEDAAPLAVRPAALIVTAIEDIETTAAALAAELQLTVEVAQSRATALRLLERRSFAVVVVDQILVDADGEGADLIWKHAGLAVPLQLSFALAGSARLQREVRAALARREREEQLAGTAAAAAIDGELKNAITGFLLESRLALAEEGLPPQVEDRLRSLAGMADRLRERLARVSLNDTTSVGLRPAG